MKIWSQLIQIVTLSLFLMVLTGCQTADTSIPASPEVTTPLQTEPVEAQEIASILQKATRPAGPTPTLTQPSITPVKPTSDPAPAIEVAKTTCTPTLVGDLGPEYVWNTPMRSTVGQGHVLTGVVRSSVDCSPLAKAKLEFWLAGPDGQYGDAYRATLLADERGTYRFESNFPGKYPERPVPHIHLYVSAEGYQGVITEYHPSSGQTESSLDLVLAPEDPAVKLVAADTTLVPFTGLIGQIAFHSQRDDNMEIYLMDLAESNKAKPINLTHNPAEDFFPTWSPDGQYLAFASDREGNPDIFVMAVAEAQPETEQEEPVNLTHHPDEDVDHTWSPDGSQIAFASNRDGNWEIYVVPVEETGGREVTRLTNQPGDDWAPAWSPDGSSIAFSGQGDIWLMGADGSEPRNLTNSQTVEEDQPAWSPDGAYLAFSAFRDGNADIYLIDVEEMLSQSRAAGIIRLTANPAEDSYPTWSPDGSYLVFKSSRDGNYEIYAMDVEAVIQGSSNPGLTRLTDNPAGDGFPVWQP